MKSRFYLCGILAVALSALTIAPADAATPTITPTDTPTITPTPTNTPTPLPTHAWTWDGTLANNYTSTRNAQFNDGVGDSPSMLWWDEDGTFGSIYKGREDDAFVIETDEDILLKVPRGNRVISPGRMFARHMTLIEEDGRAFMEIKSDNDQSVINLYGNYAETGTNPPESGFGSIGDTAISFKTTETGDISGAIHEEGALWMDTANDVFNIYSWGAGRVLKLGSGGFIGHRWCVNPVYVGLDLDVQRNAVVHGNIDYSGTLSYTGPTYTPTATPTITPTPTPTGANPQYVGNEKLYDDGVDTIGGGAVHVGRLYLQNDRPVATATPVKSYFIVSGKNGGEGGVIVSNGAGFVYFTMTAAGEGNFFNDTGTYTFSANGDEDHKIVMSYADGAMILTSVDSTLKLVPDSGIVQVTGDVRPTTDNTYYLGKNDDDSPASWKGVILKDTANGKYYRIQVTNGTINAVDLTD